MWKPIALSLAIACLSGPVLAQANADPDQAPRYGYRVPYSYYPPAYYPPAYGYYAPPVYWRPYFATTWFDPYERPYFATPWVAVP
jgi:hypothetical protein